MSLGWLPFLPSLPLLELALGIEQKAVLDCNSGRPNMLARDPDITPLSGVSIFPSTMMLASRSTCWQAVGQAKGAKHPVGRPQPCSCATVMSMNLDCEWVMCSLLHLLAGFLHTVFLPFASRAWRSAARGGA